MIQRLSHILTRLSHGGRGRYLIVEEGDASLVVTPLRILQDKKRIEIGKRYFAENFSKLKKPFLRRFDVLVVGFGSRHVKTVERVVRIPRFDSRSVLTESELDSLVFRGLWDFLNRYRGWAAGKLGIAETELTLAHISIADVCLDSHRVFNPEGFHGKQMYVRFRGTFIDRISLAALRMCKTLGEEVFVVEAGSALSAHIDEPSYVFVHAGMKQAHMFRSHGDERNVYVDGFSWGVGSVVHALAERFGVCDDVATTLLRCYTNNQVSQRMKRYIESRLKPQFQELSAQIIPFLSGRKAATKYSTHFYFSQYVPFVGSFLKEPQFRIATFSKKAELLGFSIVHRHALGENLLSYVYDSSVALALYPFVVPQLEPLNQLLRRRVRWLIPYV